MGRILDANFEMNKVSVILPVHNAEQTIRRAICSVQKQSYDNWEICAVDDASSDASRCVLQEIAAKEPRLHIFSHAQQAGAGEARNFAIKKSNGRYIAFLDADDEWLPNKLELQLKFMQEHHSVFSCTAYYRYQNGKPRRTTSVPLKANACRLLKNNTVGTLTAIYDKNHFGERLMPNIKRRQDYALWLDLLNQCDKVDGLNEALAIHHRGHKSLSSNKFKAAYAQWQFFRQVVGLNMPRAVWYFGHYAVNSTLRNL